MHQFVSSAPIANVTREQIWNNRKPVGTDLDPEMEFREVFWLRESQSLVVMTHGGKDIDTFGAYVDRGVPLRSVGPAIANARRQAVHFAIDHTSTAQVLVRTTIVDRPVLMGRAPGPSGAKHATGGMEPDREQWWMEPPGHLVVRLPMGDNQTGDGPWRWPAFADQIRVVFEGVIWSTKCPDDPEDLRQQLLAQHFRSLVHKITA